MPPDQSLQPTRPFRRGPLRPVAAVGRAAELRIRQATSRRREL